MAATSVCSSGQTATSASSKGVRVVLRERRRTASDEGEPVLVPLASGGVELNNDPSGGSKFGRSVIYNFDSFYSQEATQDDIFDREVKDSLRCLLQGINLTIMAYGATGSGKTFTMQGSDTAPGIIPRALQELLHLRDVAISSREAGSLSLHVSYLEIYNDRIYDLLSPCRQELAVRQSTDAGVFVAGLTEVPVLCIEDFSRAYSRGVDNRTTGPTALNHFSSRSHALLMLTVKNKVSAERLLTGKLYLIDLAGSEDNRRTGNTGVRLTESGGINSSLFVLGKCVSAINAGSKRVPFRDSKLTRLLQDSLGGSTQSLMIVAISPGSNHFAATYQTLQFASKSRQIVNVPVANVTVTKKQEEEKRVLEIAAQARLKRQQRLMKTTLTKPGKAGTATGEGRRAARTPLVGLATTIARASDIDREKENQQSKGKLASKTMPTSSTTTEGTPIPVRTPLSISKLIPIATPNTEHSSNSNSTRPARLKEVRRSQRQRTLKIATDQLFTQDDSLDSGIDDADHDQDAYPCYQPSSSSDDDGADSRSFFDDDDDDDGDELPKRGKKPAAKRQRVRAAIPASSETHRPSLSLVSEEIERELLIYLNSHPLKDLQSLHCIGKKRADLILACRPFSTLENLSMIGLKKASLADFVQRNAASLQLHQQKQKD